jgi:uncharacterized membrane protein
LPVSFHILSFSFDIYLFLFTHLYLSSFICFFHNVYVSFHILSVSLHIYLFLSTVTWSVSFCVLCSLSRIAKLQKFRHSKLQVFH